MVPTGSFDRLKRDVIEQYKGKDIPITFGVLIADYRQSLAREYILNYVDVFDKKSNKCIDFFIPGYAPFCTGERTKLMDRDNNPYFFNIDMFLDFISKFEQTFDVPYEFNPMLILIEFDGANFEKSKKMVLALDEEDGGIKKSGVLFQKIFEIAECHVHVSLEDISYNLVSTYVKDNIIDSIISALGNDIIMEGNTLRKNICKYKLT